MVKRFWTAFSNGFDLLTAVALILFFVPLIRPASVNSFLTSSSTTWNDLSFLAPLVLVFMEFCLLLSRRLVVHARELIFLLLITIGIVVLWWLSPVSEVGWYRLLEYVTALWFVPVILGATRRYGRALVLAVVVSVVLLHSVWGVYHFVMQQSLGLSVMGEVVLDPTGEGIAKFAWHDRFGELPKLVRAYGPYPHANSLSGSLVMGLMLFAVLRPAPRQALPLVGVIVLALLLTFSRAGWLGGIIVFLVSFGWGERRGHYRFMVPLLITFLVFSPLVLSRLTDQEDVAVSERAVGATAALEIIATQSWWHGVGAGAYVPALASALVAGGRSYQSWQLAPAHSVPLLLAAEWGLLAAGALALAGVLVVVRVRQWALLALIPLLLFDHYLATQLPSGLLLVTVVVLLGLPRHQSAALAAKLPVPQRSG